MKASLNFRSLIKKDENYNSPGVVWELKVAGIQRELDKQRIKKPQDQAQAALIANSHGTNIPMEASRNIPNGDKSTFLPNQNSELHASRLINLSKEQSKDG